MLIVVVVTAFGAEAKSSVEALFKGDFKKKPDVSQIVVKGSQLAGYGLDTFMSMTVTTPEDREAVAKAVEADAHTAKSKEVTYSGGKMAYGFLTIFTSSAGGNEYVFYYSNDKKAVVMYMEGDATPEKIKKLIKKK